jgi:DNA polymerase-3 subunit beta
LDLHANNPLHEEAEETVAVEYDGEPMEIAFNVGFLLEALSTMQGERVRVTFIDTNSACVLTDLEDPNSLYVVSPMML